jgi:hypothetical protein
MRHCDSRGSGANQQPEYGIALVNTQAVNFVIHKCSWEHPLSNMPSYFTVGSVKNGSVTDVGTMNQDAAYGGKIRSFIIYRNTQAAAGLQEQGIVFRSCNLRTARDYIKDSLDNNKIKPLSKQRENIMITDVSVSAPNCSLIVPEPNDSGVNYGCELSVGGGVFYETEDDIPSPQPAVYGALSTDEGSIIAGPVFDAVLPATQADGTLVNEVAFTHNTLHIMGVYTINIFNTADGGRDSVQIFACLGKPQNYTLTTDIDNGTREFTVSKAMHWVRGVAMFDVTGRTEKVVVKNLSKDKLTARMVGPMTGLATPIVAGTVINYNRGYSTMLKDQTLNLLTIVFKSGAILVRLASPPPNLVDAPQIVLSGSFTQCLPFTA